MPSSDFVSAISMLMQPLTDFFSNFFSDSNQNNPFELDIVQRDKILTSPVAWEKNVMTVSYTDKYHHTIFFSVINMLMQLFCNFFSNSKMIKPFEL